MLLALCDTNTDSNGIMWDQDQWNHIIPMAVPIVLFDQKAILHLILTVLT